MAASVSFHVDANMSNSLKGKGASLTVRVEGEGNSVGRCYSASARDGSLVVKGLGATRRALRCKTFEPDTPVVLESQTLPNLATASRDRLLDYFRNTWALTDTLFRVRMGATRFLV
jgi:hypothetical protein